MAILGPKIIDLNSGTLIYSMEITFINTYKQFKLIWGVFYHDPNVGVDLPWLRFWCMYVEGCKYITLRREREKAHFFDQMRSLFASPTQCI
jgi:hypothetical protein